MANLEQLIVDFKESLERDLARVEEKVDRGFAEVKQRFDDQSARMDRHGGLLRAGSLWISRTDTWAEKVDASLEVKDREIADLRERIARLERKSP